MRPGGHRVLYISGEESTAQTMVRAGRLGVGSPNLYIVCETDMDVIAGHVEELDPFILVVDSIQIVYRPDLESAPGSVSQVRESAARLMFMAKGRGCIVFVIGHVTKSGAIAGPRLLEHMVDTVLYFEGDRYHLYRILRAVKNRFGSTDEIAIFQMTEGGLMEVTNPSEMFIAERRSGVSGSIVVPVIEGTRPLLVEVQSLVSPTSFGLPVRRTSGVDANRLSMIIAVLQRRVGLSLGDKDVYVNIVGGMRVSEPAADLGVAVATASSMKDKPASADVAVFGEIGLGGEIRAAPHPVKRVKESVKLGFKKVVLPRANLDDVKHLKGGRARRRGNRSGSHGGDDRMSGRIVGIIAAAGRGERLGAGPFKALVSLCGRPIISWTAEALSRSGMISDIIVVGAPGALDGFREALDGVPKISMIVEGEESRAGSVARGFEAVGDDCVIAVVHDGARPFIEVALIDDVIGAALKWGGRYSSRSVCLHGQGSNAGHVHKGND